MNQKDKKLIIIGIIISIVIVCLAPMIASGDPDGLEKSAEDAGVGETEPFLASPFPDYTFEPLGTFGEIGVLFLGLIITLGLGYVLAMFLKKN